MKHTVFFRITAALFMLLILVSGCRSERPDYGALRVKNPQDTTPRSGVSYPIVDTGQSLCFNNRRAIAPPAVGTAFYGQDAQYMGFRPSHVNNGDGTVTDKVTGLMWQKGYMVTDYSNALNILKTFRLAGHSDWRLPTIKELYSLMRFDGEDISPGGRPGGGPGHGHPPEGRPPRRGGIGHGPHDGHRPPPGGMHPPRHRHGRGPRHDRRSGQKGKPFIDKRYFDFKYGANGRRPIDTQIISTTLYRGRTMGGNLTVFGLNVADGRIKGYPVMDPRSRRGKKFVVRFVRGNVKYGKNVFQDNKNGTVSDLATGLMWAKIDSQKAMKWQQALVWIAALNRKKYLGYSDWRLPDAKELQSIVDYSRSPQETASAALDPVFSITRIKDEGGRPAYPWFWSSTTHKSARGGAQAVYICFGRGLGFFAPPNSGREKKLMDVHGAGSQRSDPKSGEPSDYPQGHGPQGDVRRVYNFVRAVRTIR